MQRAWEAFSAARRTGCATLRRRRLSRFTSLLVASPMPCPHSWDRAVTCVSCPVCLIALVQWFAWDVSQSIRRVCGSRGCCRPSRPARYPPSPDHKSRDPSCVTAATPNSSKPVLDPVNAVAHHGWALIMAYMYVFHSSVHRNSHRLRGKGVASCISSAPERRQCKEQRLIPTRHGYSGPNLRTIGKALA